MDNLDMCWWQQPEFCMWSLFCRFTVEPLLLDSLSYRHLLYHWHYILIKDRWLREMCASNDILAKECYKTKRLISMSCKQDCYHQLYLYLVVNTNELKLENFTRWLIMQNFEVGTSWITDTWQNNWSQWCLLWRGSTVVHIQNNTHILEPVLDV